MSFSAAFAIALGTALVRYLAKTYLSGDLQQELASEMLSAGIDWLTKKSSDRTVDHEIAARIQRVYDSAPPELPENDKLSVVYDVALTLALAKTDVRHLLFLKLNPDLLYGELLDTRPEVFRTLSAAAVPLYKKMLRVTADVMIETLDPIKGLLLEYARISLEGQAHIIEEQGDVRKQLEVLNDRILQFMSLQRGLYPISAIQENIPLEDYLRRLHIRELALDLPGLPDMQPTLEEIYIRLSKEAIEKLDSEPLIQVEDIAGAGKSTLLKDVIIHHCELFLSDEKDRVPIVMKARHYAPDSRESLETTLLKTTAGREQIDITELRNLLQLGKLIFIIDGIDEASESSRVELLDAIKVCDTVTSPSGNQLIIAGRHLTYFRPTGFDVVGLNRLNIASAYKLIRNWQGYLQRAGVPMKNIANLDILADYVTNLGREGRQLDRILSTPLHLTYLITLAANMENDESIRRIARSQIALYKRIIESAIPYWEAHKRNAAPGDMLSTFSLTPVVTFRSLYAIGFTLQLDNAHKHLLQLFSNVQEHCRRYLKEVRDEQLYESYRYWTKASVLKEDAFIGTIDFWHTEMREYCAARYLYEVRDPEGSLPEEYSETLYQSGWDGVRHLYMAMCSTRGGAQ